MNFCFDSVPLVSDLEAPKTVQEALYMGKAAKDAWMPSITKVMNFLWRKLWKKVDRLIPVKDDRIMKMTWQFKKNRIEQEDKSI